MRTGGGGGGSLGTGAADLEIVLRGTGGACNERVNSVRDIFHGVLPGARHIASHAMLPGATTRGRKHLLRLVTRVLGPCPTVTPLDLPAFRDYKTGMDRHLLRNRLLAAGLAAADGFRFADCLIVAFQVDPALRARREATG